MLNTAGRQGHLFTFLEPGLLGIVVNTTTTTIEGAINSGIWAVIFHHHGILTDHRRRAVKWFCWGHADQAAPPALGELPEPER